MHKNMRDCRALSPPVHLVFCYFVSCGLQLCCWNNRKGGTAERGTPREPLPNLSLGVWGKFADAAQNVHQCTTRLATRARSPADDRAEHPCILQELEEIHQNQVDKSNLEDPNLLNLVAHIEAQEHIQNPEIPNKLRMTEKGG